MYFCVDGYPGTRIPFVDNEKFEDYYLEFPGVINPVRIGMLEECFAQPPDSLFEL